MSTVSASVAVVLAGIECHCSGLCEIVEVCSHAFSQQIAAYGVTLQEMIVVCMVDG